MLSVLWDNLNRKLTHYKKTATYNVESRRTKDSLPTNTTQNIIAGLPGSENEYSLKEFKAKLDLYKKYTKSKLRENLIYFLKSIIPTAEKYGVFMCIHPDDPPDDLFNIPRIVSTFDDLKYTGQTNYVEGISRILIKNLNKMNKLERPIHCSDVKRKVLYIKNEEGWEKDNEHEKINKCIKDVEFKQIQKIPEWTKEENIDIYKDNDQGMKYQKVVLNSMGGMDHHKREKNKKSVIKKLSETTDFKD